MVNPKQSQSMEPAVQPTGASGGSVTPPVPPPSTPQAQHYDTPQVTTDDLQSADRHRRERPEGRNPANIEKGQPARQPGRRSRSV